MSRCIPQVLDDGTAETNDQAVAICQSMWMDAMKSDAAMTLERKQVTLTEVKADNLEAGSFTGYAAVFGNVDAYGDVIERGAFKQTLQEWETRGKWPKMLLQHGGFLGGAEDLLSVGQWTDMTENAHGLKVAGRLFNLDTDLGKRIYVNMKEGELDALSIGFMTRKMKLGTKPGEPARTLLDVDLKEVSLVTFPANEQALITAVKSLKKHDVEGILRDEGLSWKAAKRVVSILCEKAQRDVGHHEPDSITRDELMPDVLTILRDNIEAVSVEALKASLQRL